MYDASEVVDCSSENNKTRATIDASLRLIADAVDHMEESVEMMERKVERNKEEVLKSLEDQKNRMRSLERRMEVVEEKIDSFIGKWDQKVKNPEKPDDAGIVHLPPRRPPSISSEPDPVVFAHVGGKKSSPSTPSTYNSFPVSATTRSLINQFEYGNSTLRSPYVSPLARPYIFRRPLSGVDWSIPSTGPVTTAANSLTHQVDVGCISPRLSPFRSGIQSLSPALQTDFRSSLQTPPLLQQSRLPETSVTRKSSIESIMSSSLFNSQKLYSKSVTNEEGTLVFLVFTAPPGSSKQDNQTTPPAGNTSTDFECILKKSVLSQGTSDANLEHSVKAAPTHQTSNQAADFVIPRTSRVAYSFLPEQQPRVPSDSSRPDTAPSSLPDQPPDSSPYGSDPLPLPSSHIYPSVSKSIKRQSVTFTDSVQPSISRPSSSQLSTIHESRSRCSCLPPPPQHENKPVTNQIPSVSSCPRCHATLEPQGDSPAAKTSRSSFLSGCSFAKKNFNNEQSTVSTPPPNPDLSTCSICPHYS